MPAIRIRNLPRALEQEKLSLLTDKITAAFGAPPRTYLAGRYGFGPHTGEILEELGYEVDISAAASIDYSADGGPDYSGYTSEPVLDRKLPSPARGLPGSGGYVDATGRRDAALSHELTGPSYDSAHFRSSTVRGVSRSNLGRHRRCNQSMLRR